MVFSDDSVSFGVSFMVASERIGVEGSDGGGVHGYSIANPGLDTDEGTSAGYLPRDVWVFQYDGVGDDALLLGRARYVEVSGATDIQAVASASENTLVFVANTHDANIEWGEVGTLGRMKRVCQEIKAESDCYGNNLYATNDLTFSGIYKGVINSSSISVELFRNVARLDFTLINGPASGMTLRDVQLCNVPRDLCYAGGILPLDLLFPSVINYFDYPSETLLSASAPGGVQLFTFYMPANQRGKVMASTSGKSKSENAPSYSSYFKITALDAQNKAYVYRIYPGANIVNDYNISANHRYSLELTVNAPGDESADARVESYGQVDFESSNSFILNPPPEGSADRIFTIPIDKVNEFWPSADATLTIGEGELWTAHVIWQDTPNPNFIHLNDPTTGLPATAIQGRGPDQRIALTINSASEGNALIGIKKVGQEAIGYLWSWHVWVTPYNPKYKVMPVENQFVYSVPAGAIHRYRGAMWTDPSGRYSTKYIMDRSLGARNAGRSFEGALYYQFGRKDPMARTGSGNILYDNLGVPLLPADPRNSSTMIVNVGTTGVTLATGVLNPTIYYYCQNGYLFENWTSQGKENGYLWNHPIAGTDHKSMFDPCPTGWEVPQDGVWSDFVFKLSNPELSTVLNGNRDKRLSWDYNRQTGLVYWPKDMEINGTIYYPSLGYRHANNAALSSMDQIAYYWTSTVLTKGISLDARQYTVNVRGGSWRAHGFPVRCVQR